MAEENEDEISHILENINQKGRKEEEEGVSISSVFISPASPLWPQGGAVLCGPLPLRRAERQKDISRLPCGSKSPAGPPDDVELRWWWKGQQWRQHPWVPWANGWAPRGCPAIPQTGRLLCHMPPSRNLPSGQGRENSAGRDCPLHRALHEELRLCQGRE